MSYVNLDFTKPLAQLLLLLRRDILITQKDHAPFGNQQAQLIFLLVREILELQTNKLSANMSGKRNDLLCCR